jgi:hypothetical protein
MTDQRGLLDVIPDIRNSRSTVPINSSFSTLSTISDSTAESSRCNQVKIIIRQGCQTYKSKIQENHQNNPQSTYTFIYFFIVSFVVLILLCNHAYNPITSSGKPQELSCRNWYWTDAASCGIDGASCTPFVSASAPIRCPGRCSWYDPSLQIWGDNTNGYHAHSRICVAAIHAQIIPVTGGCGLVHLSGSARSFQSSVGGGGIVSKYQNESFYKTFKFSPVDQSNCPGFDSQLVILSLGYLFCILSVCLPTSIMQPPLIVLYSQPLIFGCFYLQLVNNQSLSSSGAARMVKAVGNMSCILMVILLTYYYSKDRVLKLIDLNAALRNENIYNEEDDDDKNDSCLHNWCIGGQERLCYCLLYVTPVFIGLHVSWFANIEGMDITFDATLFQDTGLSLVIKILVVMGLIAFSIYIFIHLVKIAYKESRLVHVLGTYGLYIAIMVTTRYSLLPCYGVHLHHGWLSFVLWFGINFKSKPALFVAALLAGTFVDGICSWEEYTFLNIWQTQSCPPSAASSRGGGSGGNSGGGSGGGPQNFFHHSTGNLSVVEVHSNNITVSFPSAVLMNSVFNVGAQSIMLISNQMIRLHALHSNAVRDGHCDDQICTFTATNLYDDSSYKFQYSLLGMGDRLRYQSPVLKVITSSSKWESP